ncbi:hypothetical protein J7W19_27030 [Streptomyces mobaraensis NBRC 13819 = DSM 40847]|uniref:Uncharacterized protein n=1 Tax=Streptomyces mobaraensis (strain ATCC 29032 / DSM 40847 / JCM 4168 / NBRC 13819 / NCIMB 11159 / IPCR 16-22) TaxID=1223523 RepID=M3B0X4_STRM1|nr:DUF6339 family protein [Streptomyces mobaraensis]EME99582.1 hypothetical protein H340_15746 [Streptomyces mobaraensis NBRC 13819 = DSM 40847]QTT76544.1 hypothetical protein J7W19_27030 [Streptomyces mobaraensis NBRC 13819 = DSM 40847]
MTDRPSHLPERLALLPNAEAAEFLTEGLLTGREDVQSLKLNRVTEPLPHTDRRGELLPVRDLAEDAMAYCRAGGLKATQADAWLAPRLHAALRLTRREAADPGFWNYLSLGVAPDYVIWRHLSDTKVAADRFRGQYHKQSFARLWWAAELFRDGSDYSPVVTACANQDIMNTALRMSVINHRPTAQAIVRLVAKSVITTGREVNALMGAVNASAATLMYDVIAPDVERESRPLLDWIAEAEYARQVSRQELPTGPEEEPAPELSVSALVDYFSDLFADAPVRGREDLEGTA